MDEILAALTRIEGKVDSQSDVLASLVAGIEMLQSPLETIVEQLTTICESIDAEGSEGSEIANALRVLATKVENMTAILIKVPEEVVLRTQGYVDLPEGC